MAAQVQFDKGQADAAAATLAWVADHAGEDEYRTVARLRLAGVLLDAKQYDEALKQLDGAKAPRTSRRLVADRRGDVLLAQGKTDEARSAYQAAWKAMDEKVDYRRLVEAKLTALGAAPAAAGRRRRRRPPSERGAAAPAGAGAAVLALAALAACAADKPKPTPLEAVDATDRRPPGLVGQRIDGVQLPAGRWPCATASSSWPASDGTRAGAGRRQRPRALARPAPARR